jgi:hypothetical protein
MGDTTEQLRLALRVTQAWPDKEALDDVVRQSEASPEGLLSAVVEMVNLLVGLIAHAERTTEEATFEKMDLILEGHAAREACSDAVGDGERMGVFAGHRPWTIG